MGIFPEDTGTEGDIMGLFDFIHSICDITKNMGRQWDTNGEKNRILGEMAFRNRTRNGGWVRKHPWDGGDVDPMSRGMTEPTPTRSNSENMLPPSTSMVKP